jgi:hypothetical protein
VRSALFGADPLLLVVARAGEAAQDEAGGKHKDEEQQCAQSEIAHQAPVLSDG